MKYRMVQNKGNQVHYNHNYIVGSDEEEGSSAYSS